MTGARAAAGVGLSNRDQALGAAYPITLPVFAGPLDLLLHLIEREELDISEVSLVAVTDQYLRTLEQLEEIQPGALADFLVVASRLLYIKSMRLLPKPPAAEGDEEESDSDTLIRHLLEYRRFKEAAGALRVREELGMRVFVRPGGAGLGGDVSLRPPDLGDLDLAMLHSALRRALERMPVDVPPPTVQPYTVTVAEQIERVRARFVEAWQQAGGQGVELSFLALLGEQASRLEIVVTFLAVLELIKQQELYARQSATFGEIVLTTTAPAGQASPVLTATSEPDERAAEETGSPDTQHTQHQ